MTVDVVNTVVIDRPVEVVSQYAADPDKAPEWYENIKSVEWKTPRPARVGSRVDFVAHFSRPPIGVHVRNHRIHPSQAPEDANVGTAFTHGDDVHMGGRPWRHTNDAAKSGDTKGLLSLARASDVVFRPKRESEGPRVAETAT